MATQTISNSRPNNGVISRIEMELIDVEAALTHLNSAIHHIYECVANTPDDFYAHKCMDDHATAVARLQNMKRALEDRRCQLRILSQASAPSAVSAVK